MQIVIDKKSICEMIPHAGGMCLIDSVIEWDETSITCKSNTHRCNDNPLRNKNGLPMSALIEYGAQAMAVHGSLVPGDDEQIIREGYLASLRDVYLGHGYLSDIEQELNVHAKRVHAASGNMIYELSIHADGLLLASGRATVVGIFGQDKQ